MRKVVAGPESDLCLSDVHSSVRIREDVARVVVVEVRHDDVINSIAVDSYGQHGLGRIDETLDPPRPGNGRVTPCVYCNDIRGADREPGVEVNSQGFVRFTVDPETVKRLCSPAYLGAEPDGI